MICLCCEAQDIVTAMRIVKRWHPCLWSQFITL